MDLCANGGRIHIGYARIDVAHGPECLVDISGVDGRRKAVRHAVGNVNGLLKALAGYQAYHRTKDLFLSDTHFAVNVTEYGGLKEPSVGVGGACGTLSAQRQLCSLALANLYIFFRGFNLLPVDLRAHLHALVESVTYFKVLGALCKLGRKLPVYAFLNNDAAGGGAALSGGAKCAPQHAVERQIKVGIVQNYDGVLPAHLQRAGFEAARRYLAHNAA